MKQNYKEKFKKHSITPPVMVGLMLRGNYE